MSTPYIMVGLTVVAADWDHPWNVNATALVGAPPTVAANEIGIGGNTAAGGTLPASATGYVLIDINGVQYKMPYF